MAESVEVIKNLCPQCSRERPEGVRCDHELAPILKVDYPNDGKGIFTYLHGYKYPYPGFADQNLVDLNAIVKRVLITSIFAVTEAPLRYTLPILFFCKDRVVTQWCKWFGHVVDAAYKGWGSNQTKYPQPLSRFSHAVRELLRVGELHLGTETFYRQCLMGFCMALEYDNAYRFRVQDILSSLNKQNLALAHRREIARLLEVGLSRELLKGDMNSVDTKWKRLLFMAKVGLFLYPRLARYIRDFLMDLNLDEIKPDAGDQYYMNERFDYNFGGKTYEERLVIKNAEDRIWKKEHPEATKLQERPTNQPFIGILPSDTFWALPEADAQKMCNDGVANFMKEFRARKMGVAQK